MIKFLQDCNRWTREHTGFMVAFWGFWTGVMLMLMIADVAQTHFFHAAVDGVIFYFNLSMLSQWALRDSEARK